jgi:hypothetical protein
MSKVRNNGWSAREMLIEKLASDAGADRFVCHRGRSNVLEAGQEREPAVVHYDDIPRLIALGLKDHFFPDWNERWQADRYMVTYRIGQVEEKLSFTPGEIEGAMGATAQHFVMCMADDMGRLAMKSSTPGRPTVAEMIAGIGRDGQNLVEHLVRRKHRLPKVLNPPPEQARCAIRGLIASGCVPQNEAQQVVWSAMLFGLVMWHVGQPIDHNHLEVTDRSQAELEATLKRARELMRQVDAAGGDPALAARLARLEADVAAGEGLGIRTFTSHRVSVN